MIRGDKKQAKERDGQKQKTGDEREGIKSVALAQGKGENVEGGFS